MYLFNVLLLITSQLVFIYHVVSPVYGASVDTVVVPSERNQGLLPRTLSTLVSRINLGKGSSLRNHDSRLQDVQTAKGVKYRRLVQTYGGYEVRGTSVSAELFLDNQFTGHLSGNVVRDLSADIPDPEVCQRKLDDVMAVAVAAEGFSFNDARIQEKNGRRIAFVKSDSKATMAYMVDFFIDTTDSISRPQYIIDACDDTIHDSYPLMNNATVHKSKKEACGNCNPSVPGYGGNPKTGRTTYNVAPLCLKVSKSGSTCTMEGDYVKVVNNMGSSSRSRSTPISFTCSSGYTDSYGNRNGAYGVANDAMYFGYITGDFYRKKYSFSALPWTPKLVIHYGNNYENAFWTGRDMYFGDGRNLFYPLVCLDVTSHELAHGITSTNSNLVYRNQPGGMNEAFSDISGEVIEYYSRNSNDWLVGADIMKSRRALRYFQTPSDDGRSISHVRDYYNGLDVHYSSGIYNHAFYRMVFIHKMPIYDAYKCFLDANRNRWSQYTEFTEGACNVVQSCYAEGFNHNDAINAFSTVGISFGSCRLSLRSATVYSGQNRPGILVSTRRSPIMEVSVDKGRSVIRATSADGSDVSLVLASDEGATEVIKKGANSLQVESDKDDKVIYLKLSSTNLSDTKVALEVKSS